jgi:hypothetical protein
MTRTNRSTPESGEPVNIVRDSEHRPVAQQRSLPSSGSSLFLPGGGCYRSCGVICLDRGCLNGRFDANG